jgi:general secretion pathway protein A
MYESFFKLNKKPFELVPDPEFIYLSRSHRKALTYLDYGIRERVGFILLTGEVGSGKTTLIRDLLNKKYEKVVLAKVFNTRVSSEQLVAMINDDFGLPVLGKDKVALMRELNDFLVQQFAAGRQPILIIDEAQNLDADLLEEVRMLSNLESSRNKLLQIILVGQPELRETLASKGLLQLRQRISISCHLVALTREETAQYIEHRMEVAGNASALAFTDETLDLVHSHSRGIPRLINIFCDFLLLSAFSDESRTVTGAMVQDVIEELDFQNHFWGSGEPESPADPATPPQLAEAVRPSLLGGGEAGFGERDLLQQVPLALLNVCASIESLRVDLAAQVLRTEQRLIRSEEQVGELRREMESLVAALDGLSSGKPQPRFAPAPGFSGRVVESIGGSGGKL